MATNNRRWGAERIRDELLKLDIYVSKRTIQKSMKQIRPKHARGQTWKTFLHNHAAEVWGCDFLQVTSLWQFPGLAWREGAHCQSGVREEHEPDQYVQEAPASEARISSSPQQTSSAALAHQDEHPSPTPNSQDNTI